MFVDWQVMTHDWVYSILLYTLYIIHWLNKIKPLFSKWMTMCLWFYEDYSLVENNFFIIKDANRKLIVKNTNENSSEYMETIISVVDSIIQRSIDYVQKLNSDSSKVDISHGNSENTQQHGATIG